MRFFLSPPMYILVKRHTQRTARIDGPPLIITSYLGPNYSVARVCDLEYKPGENVFNTNIIPFWLQTGDRLKNDEGDIFEVIAVEYPANTKSPKIVVVFGRFKTLNSPQVSVHIPEETLRNTYEFEELI